MQANPVQYRGNTKLKGTGVKQGWTKEMMDEWKKCRQDPSYFCEKYVMITDIDKGLIKFKLRDYQKDMIQSMHKNRYTVGVMARQSGKTTTYVGFALHHILFYKKKTVAILANRGETAREILGKIQEAYENLPKWMQHGVIKYNEGSFELENGSRCLASATSSSAIRGYAISCLILDEIAFIDNWDEFYTSVYPTISSGKQSKLIMVSTPNGLNHFYKIVTGQKEGSEGYGMPGKNGFVCFDVTWKQVPGRDEKWREETLAAMNWDYQKFSQEYENEFVGSSGTLLGTDTLKELNSSWKMPTRKVGALSIYEEPIPNRNYYLIADVARGKGLDYSAFSIIDCTSIPYRQVATFRTNSIQPTEYASHIYAACKMYGDPYVLVEVNDIGAQVSDTLNMQYAYENVLCTMNRGHGGKRIIGTGLQTSNIDAGVRTTPIVKTTGCSLLKIIMESKKLVVFDKPTIDEFNVFSKKTDNPKSQYEAESGHNDDMVMGLVLFAWLSDQAWFKEETQTDVRTSVLTDSREQIQQEYEIDLPDFHVIDGRESFRYTNADPDLSDFF